jgi:hypothetical protein
MTGSRATTTAASASGCEKTRKPGLREAGPCAASGTGPGPAAAQLMWIPEIARLITSRCTSLVPSKIV